MKQIQDNIDFMLLVRQRGYDIASNAASLSEKGAPLRYQQQMKIALFDTLRANASRQNIWLFSDKYLREAENLDPTSLASMLLTSKSEDPSSFSTNTSRGEFFQGVQKKVCRVMVEAELVDDLINILPLDRSAGGDDSLIASSTYFNLIVEQTSGGERYFFLEASSRALFKLDESKLIQILGTRGFLPSREKLLERYIAKEFDHATKEDLLRKFNTRLDKGLPAYQPLSTDYKGLTQTDVSETTLGGLTAKVIDHLVSMLDEKDSALNGDARHFYYRAMKNMVADLTVSDKDIPDELQEGFKQTLQRMVHILTVSSSFNYSTFLMAKDLFFDEILLLQMPRNPNPTLEEKIIKANEVCNVACDFLQDQTDERPTFASFTKSGMHAITVALSRSLATVKDLEQVNICIGNGSYFEINHVLSPFFSGKGDHVRTSIGKVYRKQKNEVKGKLFSNKERVDPQAMLIDVFVGSFVNNIDLNTSGFQYNDINSFVTKQMALRKLSDDPKLRGKPLILVLDNTMSALDDIHLPMLLVEFEKEIESGNLVVICANSLNKHFHLGTDKTPLGLLSTYANKDKYPKLTSLNEHELATGELSGMAPDSPTLSLATSIMKTSGSLINEARDMSSQRARILHASVFDKALQQGMHIFKIDPPITQMRNDWSSDLQHALSNSWGFVNIRISLGTLSKISNHVAYQTQELLTKAGISFRDGYSFSETSLSWLISTTQKTKCLRVSIGTESIESLREIFEILNEFMLEVNELIDPKLSSISNINRTGDSSDTAKELEQELIQNYTVIFKRAMAKVEELVDVPFTGPPMRVVLKK